MIFANKSGIDVRTNYTTLASGVPFRVGSFVREHEFDNVSCGIMSLAAGKKARKDAVVRALGYSERPCCAVGH